MGILDDIFESGGSGVSGGTLQIVRTHSQKNEKNENEYRLSGNTRHSRHKCHSHPDHQEPTRSTIEETLSRGPKAYADVLAAVGGDEGAIREAIRGWDELIAYTDEDGTFVWEIPFSARLIPMETHGNALSCHEGEAGQPIALLEEETPLPAMFSIGQRVRFSHLRALNVLEGSIIEMQWHPAPISRWWYRVQVGEEKFWISESHIVTAAGRIPATMTPGGPT